MAGLTKEELHAEWQCMAMAIRALMLSHPDPKALRAMWDVQVAAHWADVSKADAGKGTLDRNLIRRHLDRWQSWIPSPSA